MTTLHLYKPEINPDVYFVNTGQTYWNFGTGWTFGINNVNGMGAEKLNTALSSLQLFLLDGNLNYITEVLKPYKTYRWTTRLEFVTNGGISDYVKLIIGGVTATTFPASGAPVIYTGEFTTGATGTVLFQSTAGNSVLISYLNLVEVPEDYQIDLTDDIDVPINLAIADIRDPSKRDATFSRTINIPATKTNNKFFNHIYEISGSGTYNPNKKVRALLFNAGVLQFNGFAKLDRINRIANGSGRYPPKSYDITLFGTLAELFYTLGDTLISELDFSEYDHTYNRANQVSSWYAGIIKNGAPYSNTLDGAYLTVTSCSYNAGRVQMNFSGAHGLAVNDWVLFPNGSIVVSNILDPKNYYLGEHMVHEIVSATEVVLQCPYFATAGSITTQAAGTNRVRQHTKKGEGYVYPMVEADQNAGINWNVTHFYPGIYALEILNKMMKKFKFTFDSTFLNSFIAKKFILPYGSGTLKLTNTEIYNRLFAARNTNDQLNTFTLSPTYVGGLYVGHKLGANPAPTVIDVALDNDSTLGFFDNNGVFNTGTYKYTCSNSGIYTLRSEAVCIFCWQSVPGVSQFDLNSYVDGTVQLEVYNYTTSSVVGVCFQQFTSASNWPNDTQLGSTFFLQFEVDNLNLVAGQQYGVRFRVVTLPEKDFYNGAFVGYGSNITVNYGVLGLPTVCSFSNKVKNTNIQDGDTVYMNSVLPKMKCTEFLNNIIKMFYLYVDKSQTQEKHFLIETREDYYNGGIEVVWTDKLHSTESIEITPMGEVNGKILKYSYTEDSDFYNKDHKDKFGSIYGNKKFQIDNDFAKSETESLVTFAPTVLIDQYGRTLSSIQGATDTNGQQEGFPSKQRFLVFNCASNTYAPWKHTDVIGGSGTEYRLYPYAGHLDKPDAPYFDLNFDYPIGVYFPYDSWTDRNLWNLFHKKAVYEQIDKDSKLITCLMHLKASDIFTLDFRNRFNVDGHLLRLNRISDFLVGKNIPVKTEFIKIKDKAQFATEWVGIQVGSDLGIGYDPDAGFRLGLPKYAGEGNGATQGAKSGVIVSGEGSQVGKDSYNILVNGQNNILGAGSSNMIITGYNNVIYPNLTNVFLINSNGLTITESNKSYLNGQDVTNIQSKILRLST